MQHLILAFSKGLGCFPIIVPTRHRSQLHRFACIIYFRYTEFKMAAGAILGGYTNFLLADSASWVYKLSASQILVGYIYVIHTLAHLYSNIILVYVPFFCGM